MSSLDLGIIGNCTIAAMIDAKASLVWGCFPRLDGDAVFQALLNGAVPGESGEGGFSLDLVDQCQSEQAYLPNTAILRTVLKDGHGGAVEILDFAPRFALFERIYRPPLIVRRIRPLQGRPRLRVRLRPRFENGRIDPEITRGSNHIRFVSASQTLRLTTNAPISYVLEERPFLLDRPIDLLLGGDESLEAGIELTARDLFERTRDHWCNWVRSLSIPFEWQDAVIGASITLKLCHFEETGAIVAALTTSIPEAPDTERTWDYRFCWLRDAYFVIHALNRLGGTRMMEDYLRFIGDIVEDANDGALRPVYGITREALIDESILSHLPGYRGIGPVRVGNQAHLQVQNDVYGSVVLASTHAFFDRRMTRPGDTILFEQLERLGVRAVAAFDQPDAGPWELRGSAAVHTFSAVMCWAACDRLAKIARQIGLGERAAHWRGAADRLHGIIRERAWNAELGSFVSTFDGAEMDATLLLLHEVDFLSADDPRFAATVDAVSRTLRSGDFLYRYVAEDDFGRPKTAFVICVFWYIDALAALGRRQEARDLFETVLAHRNPLGLLSEDIDPRSGELWGNFPQTYSMVGLINCAMRLSRSWEEAF
ncbi:glycoside hydrolase family 15 protein [Magnetospirillum molischianum]|uniref:Glycoside hydrolase 15-related protein n=1 Tax=Magnetospirillum molischianum DSM 120 TaxID=1150626 RepID=H8FQN5_MAGML|nr:glycoside hydrolase family 15 protein [Magnetospirillum molischianum]CCG40673.1 Glycoside hydrolase 15-related protein [Magnetospirillum molischianum DSM 120]